MRLASAVFGLDEPGASAAAEAQRQIDDEPDDLPGPGQIVLFNGPSGGGKSTRLRRLADDAVSRDYRVVHVGRLRLKPLACVDQFGTSGDEERDLAYAAGRLAQVGLGEARVLLRPPALLSDGQRWRLRLAVAISQAMRRHGRARRLGQASPCELLVIDEFCAVLDRVTAAVVARSLRRTVERLTRVGAPVAAVVATSHDDLREALLPDRVVWCER